MTTSSTRLMSLAGSAFRFLPAVPLAVLLASLVALPACSPQRRSIVRIPQHVRSGERAPRAPSRTAMGLDRGISETARDTAAPRAPSTAPRTLATPAGKGISRDSDWSSVLGAGSLGAGDASTPASTPPLLERTLTIPPLRAREPEHEEELSVSREPEPMPEETVDADSPVESDDVPEVEMPDVKIPDADLEAPDVDLQIPDADLEVPDVDLEVPDVEIPDADIEIPDVKIPDADVGADTGEIDSGSEADSVGEAPAVARVTRAPPERATSVPTPAPGAGEARAFLETIHRAVGLRPYPEVTKPAEAPAEEPLAPESDGAKSSQLDEILRGLEDDDERSADASRVLLEEARTLFDAGELESARSRALEAHHVHPSVDREVEKLLMAINRELARE